jgi:hypothetical protein
MDPHGQQQLLQLQEAEDKAAEGVVNKVPGVPLQQSSRLEVNPRTQHQAMMEVQMEMEIMEGQEMEMEMMPQVVLMIRKRSITFYLEWNRLLLQVLLYYGSLDGCDLFGNYGSQCLGWFHLA